jgi:hypothetical protein
MMRSLVHVLAALAVIGLAFWAYRENYRTQEALSRADALQSAVAGARQKLRVLTAEWAYLNRPDRLMSLVEMNYDRLGLIPLQPYQFARIDQVSYPEPAPNLTITNPVDVTSDGDRP